MNKKNLILTSTKGMSRAEWLAFRQPLTHVNCLIASNIDSQSAYKYDWYNGLFNSEMWKEFEFPCIGASEQATVMGLNPYKSVIELFFEKVGVKETPDFDNPSMFWGRELEEHIAAKWEFWNGDQETMIANYNSKQKVRKCRRINAYVQNKAYPWIFVSLDRIINKSEQYAKEGALECKTISGYASDMWESNIPPMYVVQNQTQLLACEFDFGEIAVLKDGRHFDVLPFDKNENICNAILLQSKNFYEKVKEGIKHYLLSAVAPNEQIKQDHLAEIDRLAPDPDGSVSYENYLKARFTDKGYSKAGTLHELAIAKNYIRFKSVKEEIETEMREYSNKLKAFLGDASLLDFGANGKVTYRANKNGVRALKIDIVETKEVHGVEMVENKNPIINPENAQKKEDERMRQVWNNNAGNGPHGGY